MTSHLKGTPIKILALPERAKIQQQLVSQLPMTET
jgi:hypothetical protein